MKTLVIDFETANHSPTSACSLGIVYLDEYEILHREVFLIRPPTSLFVFTPIHGLAWRHVQKQPNFGEWWQSDLRAWFHRADTLVAHNIRFDQRVLSATAHYYGIELPELKTECTVRLSRQHLQISPANLKNVTQVLGIPLQHHEALSDATAAAYIYIHAKTGARPWESGAAQVIR